MSNEQKKLKENFDIITNIFNSGNYSLAETKIKSLIKKYNNVPVLFNLLGATLNAQNKTDQAIKSYEQAIQLNPKFAIAYNNLGNIYMNKKKNKNKAKELFEIAIKYAPNFPLAYNNLGNLLKDSNKFNESIMSFEKAISLDPKNFVIYTNMGTVYSIVGEFNKAIKSYEKSIIHNPHFMLAHRNLSSLIKYTKGNTHLEQMEKLNLQKKIPDNEKIDLYMALGKAYEDLKNYEKSFNFYILGNTLKRKNVNYDIKNDIELFQNIRNTFTKDFFKKINFSGTKNTTPIFIVGMPRSGTTLVEQILSSHPEVHGAGELSELNFQINNFFLKNKKITFPKKISEWNLNNLNIIGQKYISYLKNISDDHKHIADKLPHNFLWLGLIKLIFPNAKVIHCKRNKYANCLSIFKNFFAGNIKFCYDLKELGQHYVGYKTLMKHWLEVIPNFVYEISYEELINNSEQQIKNLIQHCDLEWNSNCLKFYENKRPVHTVSQLQVRKPIYKDSIKSWEKFKFGMKPLIKELKKV